MAITINILLLLFLLALFVGSVFLQIFLSQKENKWMGRILPILSFLLSLVVPLSLAAPLDGANGWFVVQILLTLLLENIPTIVYLVVYFACREKVRRKKQLDKMNIQDLH